MSNPTNLMRERAFSNLYLSSQGNKQVRRWAEKYHVILVLKLQSTLVKERNLDFISN